MAEGPLEASSAHRFLFVTDTSDASPFQPISFITASTAEQKMLLYKPKTLWYVDSIDESNIPP